MKLFGLFEVEVLRIAFQLNEDRNAQLITFLISLASIAFGVCSPASGQGA